MWHIVIESVWFFCGSVNRYQQIHLQNLRVKCNIFVSTSIMALIRSTGESCLILCRRVLSTWRETEQWQPAHRGVLRNLNVHSVVALCKSPRLPASLFIIFKNPDEQERAKIRRTQRCILNLNNTQLSGDLLAARRAQNPSPGGSQEASRSKMPHPPYLAPVDVEDEQVCASHPTSKREPGQEASFCCLYTRAHSFSHCLQLAVIANGCNVVRLVN